MFQKNKLAFFLFLAISLPIAAYTQTDTSGEENDNIENMVDEAAQADVDPYTNETYKTTRIINGVSNESIGKHELDFTISHHFGDIAGSAGGISTFFGLDNIADYRISFDYGITDKLTVGVSRYLGVGVQRQLYETSLKYKLLKQKNDNSMPISITLYGTANAASNASNGLSSSVGGYFTFADRMAYNLQAVISRKFSKKFSLTLTPTYIQRNLVNYYETNANIAMGVGFRYKFSRRMGVIADYFYNFRSSNSISLQESAGVKYYNPLAAGLEIETGGHVFHIVFMNNMAMNETQFIPANQNSWSNGSYRWGFSISRIFNL